MTLRDFADIGALIRRRRRPVGRQDLRQCRHGPAYVRQLGTQILERLGRIARPLWDVYLVLHVFLPLDPTATNLARVPAPRSE
jgi:hypothetical protein